MNESLKTTSFVVIAVALGVGAWYSSWSTRPRQPAGFEKVGSEFFEAFTDPADAGSLNVSVYNEDLDKVSSFEVSWSDGLWRIPSHFNYPAEAADRLARTATSVMGLNREAIASRKESDHARLGVLEPDNEEADAESAGQRLTIKSRKGDLLADYIIGKPADVVVEDEAFGGGRQADSARKIYYVRVPGEKETYLAELKVDLSTRFEDWIEPDLLKLDVEDLNRIEIDNYELAERVQGRQTFFQKIPEGKHLLTKDEFSPWKLDGADPDTEQVNEARIDELTALLGDLQIVGVRPKPASGDQPLVLSDMTINTELAKSDPQGFQESLYRMQLDMEDKGFVIGADKDDPEKMMLLATKGELRAVTRNGVRYTLYFGNSVLDEEKQISLDAAASDPAAGEAENGKQDASNKDVPEDNAEPPAAESEAAGTRNRFVAIRVDFDPAGLGEAPVKPAEPVEPEKPDGYDDWKAKQEAAGAEKQEPSEEEPQEPVDDEIPAPPEDVASQSDELFKNYEAGLAEYNAAKARYFSDLEIYESELASFNKRETAGRDLVKELNERFGKWFYIVPPTSLDSLRLARGDLVQPVTSTPPPSDGPGMDFGNPGDDGSLTLPPRPDLGFPRQDGNSPEAPQESDGNPPEAENAEKGVEPPAPSGGSDSPADGGISGNLPISG
jgi:Domain of unknown function (DUF4340)